MVISLIVMSNAELTVLESIGLRNKLFILIDILFPLVFCEKSWSDDTISFNCIVRFYLSIEHFEIFMEVLETRPNRYSPSVTVHFNSSSISFSLSSKAYGYFNSK